MRLLSSVFEGADITADTQVATSAIDYIMGVDRMLRNESSGKARMLNNYLSWHVVEQYSFYVTWDYIIASHNFISHLMGWTELPSVAEEEGT